MKLLYQRENGYLEPGIHEMTWDEFCTEFGYSSQRDEMIQLMKTVIKCLRQCGCQTIYVDGSFVTQKERPGDYDICWDPAGMNVTLLIHLYPIFKDFGNRRANQKVRYKGEFFPTTMLADGKKQYIHYFQADKSGTAKGIIKIAI